MLDKRIKTFVSLCTAMAIGVGAIGTAQGATRDEIASIRVNAKGSNFQYWQKDSQALAKLRAYVKDVTNPKSPEYVLLCLMWMALWPVKQHLFALTSS